MKEALAWIFGAIVFIVVIVVLCFGLTWAGIAWTGFFGPKQAEVQQKVWVNSQPYVSGVAQDLAKEQLELAKTTDPTARASIIAYLQEQYGNVNPNTLNNPQLQIFLEEIQSGQLK